MATGSVVVNVTVRDWASPRLRIHLYCYRAQAFFREAAKHLREWERIIKEGRT